MMHMLSSWHTCDVDAQSAVPRAQVRAPVQRSDRSLRVSVLAADCCSACLQPRPDLRRAQLRQLTGHGSLRVPAGRCQQPVLAGSRLTTRACEHATAQRRSCLARGSDLRSRLVAASLLAASVLVASPQLRWPRVAGIACLSIGRYLLCSHRSHSRALAPLAHGRWARTCSSRCSRSLPLASARRSTRSASLR